MTYEVDGAIARITLNRPERGNGITLDLPVELSACIEKADLDSGVHVIALSGNGKEAVDWGLAIECAPPDRLDERFENLLGRIARMPINQLVMMKLLVNQTIHAAGLQPTQILGTVFDGIARHTREGYQFQHRAAEVGFKQAVQERDAPFGDYGASTYKG